MPSHNPASTRPLRRSSRRGSGVSAPPMNDPDAMFEAPPNIATATATISNRTTRSQARAEFAATEPRGSKRLAHRASGNPKKARVSSSPKNKEEECVDNDDTASDAKLPAVLSQKDQPSSDHGQHKSPPEDTLVASHGATKVTPAVTRQLKYDARRERRPRLPPGVVDIFQRTHCAHQRCQCPPALAPARMEPSQNVLASQHLTVYGEEYCQAIKAKEKRQHRLFFGSHPTHHGVRNTVNHDEINLANENETDAAADDARGETNCCCLHPHRTVAQCPIETGTSLRNQPLLTSKMRRVLVHWMSEVCLEYKLSDATYHLAVTMLDVILAMGPTEDEYETSLDVNCISDDEDSGDDENAPWFLLRRADFQAVGCACIWISSKMEDKRPPTIEDLVFIADYSFDADRLRHLESRICNLFNFRLHKVTPFHFLHVNLRASQACQRAHCHHFLDQTVLQEMNLYLLEICRASYCLAQHKPSLLAAACMYLSRATLGLRHHDENSNSSNHNFWSPTLEYFTGYTVKDMSHVIIAIHRLHMGAENSNVGTTPAYSKYKTAEKLRVSLRTVRRLEDIGLAPTEDHDDLDVDDQDYSVLL